MLKSLSGDRFTIYECAMVITSEISHARQTLVKNEDRVMKASEGSAAEGFMLQDSLRNLDRTLTKLNRVIKSLADTKVVGSIVIEKQILGIGPSLNSLIKDFHEAMHRNVQWVRSAIIHTESYH